METMKAIARRKSTRSYRQGQIPDDVLNTILAAGCAAPVGLGKYNVLHLTVIQDEGILKKISAGISKTMNMEGNMIYGAPTLVLVSSMDEVFPGTEHANTYCILENMAVAAADQKVDSCIIGGAGMAVNTDTQLRKALAIPDGFNPISSIALGYAVTPDDTEKALKVTISMNRV